MKSMKIREEMTENISDLMAEWVELLVKSHPPGLSMSSVTGETRPASRAVRRLPSLTCSGTGLEWNALVVSQAMRARIACLFSIMARSVGVRVEGRPMSMAV